MNLLVVFGRTGTVMFASAILVALAVLCRRSAWATDVLNQGGHDLAEQVIP